jgi:hypothetical protein
VRGTFALAVALSTLAACGGEAARRAEKDSNPPAVAELLCPGPNLRTPVVRGQADGIRVRVLNDTNREAELDYDITRGGTGGGGSTAPPGWSEHVIPFAADEISIGCSAEALGRVELRVVDPGDKLKSAELECKAYARNPPVPPKTLKGGDPVAVTRRFLRGRGLRPTDRVERALPIAGEFRTVRVVRGGRVVAAVWFDDPSPDRIGTVEACTDFRK